MCFGGRPHAALAPRGSRTVQDGAGRARGAHRAPRASSGPLGEWEGGSHLSGDLRTHSAGTSRAPLVWDPSLQTHSPGLGGGFHTHRMKVQYAVPGASVQHMLIGQLCGPGPGRQRGQGWTPPGPRPVRLVRLGWPRGAGQWSLSAACVLPPGTRPWQQEGGGARSPEARQLWPRRSCNNAFSAKHSLGEAGRAGPEPVSLRLPRNGQRVLGPCPVWCSGFPCQALPSQAPGQGTGRGCLGPWEVRGDPAVQRELPGDSDLSCSCGATPFPGGEAPEGGCPCCLPGLGSLHQPAPPVHCSPVTPTHPPPNTNAAQGAAEPPHTVPLANPPPPPRVVSTETT